MGSGSWWLPVVDQALWISYAPLNHAHQGVLSTPGCDHWQSAFGPKAKGGRDLFLWPHAQREKKLSISPSADVAKQKEMKRGRCSCLSEKHEELKAQRWSSQAHLGLCPWTAHPCILLTLPEETLRRCSILPSSKHCSENQEVSEGIVLNVSCLKKPLNSGYWLLHLHLPQVSEPSHHAGPMCLDLLRKWQGYLTSQRVGSTPVVCTQCLTTVLQW